MSEERKKEIQGMTLDQLKNEFEIVKIKLNIANSNSDMTAIPVLQEEHDFIRETHNNRLKIIKAMIIGLDK